MSRFRLVFLVGTAIIIASVVVFHLFVGIGHPLSGSGQDWGVFGDYFGGVVGALFSFLSVLLIVYTIDQQNVQIASARDESLKRDLLLHVSKADEEIERWLQKKLASVSNVQPVEFGDIVWGLVDASCARPAELTAALNRLLVLTCNYCASIALYKDNINTHFVFQQHRQKAEELISFLSHHLDKLPLMAAPSLDFCRLHLHGNTAA